MMMFDMQYMVMVLLPGLVLGGLAAFFTKATFKRYTQVGVSSQMTGAEAAREMLASQGIHDVEIHQSQGFLSDHYNPKTHSLHLSPDVYHGRSLSAIGVACHEAGHALQQAQRYPLMAVRSAMLPVTMIGQNLAFPMIMIGLAIQMTQLAWVGIILFSFAVLFSIITLPIEWDASARAKRLMVQSGIVTAIEQPHAARVLNAAFMTYLAGAITAVLTLLYFLLRAGLLGGRRDD